jgi:hypothetical protein
MSESGDQQPVEPDPYEFTATAEFRYSIFLVLLLVGVLAYGATWVPRLFKSAAPSSEASVAPAPQPAEIPPGPAVLPAPSGCHLGVGAGCDWAGLLTPRPGCYHGVGKCGWGGFRSTPSGDKVAVQSTPQSSASPPLTPAPSPPSQSPQPQAVQPQTATTASTPYCHNGAGACDWGGIKSQPSGDKVALAAPLTQAPTVQAPSPQAPSPPSSLPCHYGIGNCGWASRSSNAHSAGAGNLPVIPTSATRHQAPAAIDDCPWQPARRHIRVVPMRLPPPICRECFFEGALFTRRVRARA